MSRVEQEIRSLHNDIALKTGFKYVEYLKNPVATCKKIKNSKIALTFLYMQDPSIPKDELLSLVEKIELFSCR